MMMLDAIDATILPALALGPIPTDARALDRDAEEALSQLRARRLEAAAARGPLSSWWAGVDRRLRTDQLEHLDEPDFPAARKVAIVRALHRFNQVTRASSRFLSILEPHIRTIHAAHGRPVRILELASGSGELAMALQTRADRRRLPVELTGSDVVPEHVAAARRTAEARGVPVRFERIDALGMDHFDDGAWDLVLIAQSMHHFPPGLLARLFREAARVAGHAFVGFDGARGLRTLLFVPGVTALSLQADFLHDAWVTVRKLYAPAELELLARRAAPDAPVAVRSLPPGWTVVEIGRGR